MGYRGKALIGLLVVWQLFASGCATPRQSMVKESVGGPVWPASSEPVRIRYLGSFSRPEELEIRRGALSRLWDFIAGAPRPGLVAPHRVTVDADGTIYVTDAGLKTVQIYNRSALSFRQAPNGKNQLQSPVGLAVDDAVKRLYIADSPAGRISFLPLSDKGAPGELGKGELERPAGIALNPKTDELLVLDTRQAAVLRYDRYSLEMKGRFGSRGAAPGQFNYPSDLAVNDRGEIFVSDSLNFRVQGFSPTGEFRQTFGKAGDSPGCFSRPKGIAVDSDNNIYVVDGIFDNVQIFDPEGRLLLAFGQPGQKAGEFWMPSGIHIDSGDRIYVADTYNKRVQMFQYLKQAERK